MIRGQLIFVMRISVPFNVSYYVAVLNTVVKGVCQIRSMLLRSRIA